MSVSMTKFYSFSEALAEKVHNLGSDTLRLGLSNTAPSQSNTQWSDITEITAGNGYTTKGPSTAQVSSAQTSGTYKLTLTDVTITASGGTIGPFRYIVLYNDTASNDELIGYYDYGTSITLNDGDSFVIDFDSSNGALTIA